MKCELSFEDETTKDLLARLDLKYFLEQNIQEENYTELALKQMRARFASTTAELKARSRKRSSQLHLFAEGQVRKMFNGGLLPSLFHLNDIRDFRIEDFVAFGDNWAYFNHWQKRHKRKVTGAKVWTIVVRSGSILAFILSFIELMRLFA